MSYKVLIVPEDPTYNGSILQPLIERMMRELGKANAKIVVLTNPKLCGFEHAKGEIEAVCKRYPHYDLILFLPDRDGKLGREESLTKLTEKLQAKGIPFIAIAAHQEVEVWLLAGHKTKIAGNWQQIREDVSVKENIFKPFIDEHGDEGPSGGRERLMKDTLKNFRGLLQSCPELKELMESIRIILEVS